MIDLILLYVIFVLAVIITHIFRVKHYFMIPILALVFIILGPELNTVKQLSSYNSTDAIGNFTEGIINSPQLWLNYTYVNFKNSIDRTGEYNVFSFIIGSIALFTIYYTIVIVIDAVIGINPETITGVDKVSTEIIVALVAIVIFAMLSHAWTILKL